MKKQNVLIVLAAVFIIFAFPRAWTESFFDIVQAGTPQDVQAAVDKGADVNARDMESFGMTPLMWAAEWNKNPEVIVVLLKAGAEVNARDDDGETPLIYAAMYNPNPRVISTLLNAGADAKAKDSSGMTAVEYAVHDYRLLGSDAMRKLKKASE